MGAGHFLFCQYQRASGDDEKDLSGAGCDELVGKTEAVAVITADPVGGDAPPSPVSPDTRIHRQFERSIRASSAFTSVRTAVSKAVRSSGSGRANSMFDTHSVTQSIRIVGLSWAASPASLGELPTPDSGGCSGETEAAASRKKAGNITEIRFARCRGHSNVLQCGGRRSRCRRILSCIDGSSGLASAVAT